MNTNIWRDFQICIRVSLTGCRKCHFLIFVVFIFSKLQMTIVKNLMDKASLFMMNFWNVLNVFCRVQFIVKYYLKNPSLFMMNFKSSYYKVLLRHKYFWSKNFWQWNWSPFKVFWNLHGNAFCFLCFLNERNITNSFLMIHLKSAVGHYANLNSSFISKLFINYGPSNMLFCFFSISYLCILTRPLSKT